MRIIKIVLGMILVVGCLIQGRGQQAQAQGIPYDWSHHHLIFSKPASGVALQKLQQDPRYQMQEAWHHREALAGNSAAAFDAKALRIIRSWGPPPTTGKFPLKGAWAEGTAITATATGPVFPAAFVGASPSATDWALFTLPIAGSSTQFNMIALKNLYASGQPTVKFSYNASTGGGALNSYPTIDLTGTKIAFIENATAGATFHVLFLPATDSGAGSTYPDPVNLTNLPVCNGSNTPCEFSLQYSTSAATLSAPFYDYTPGSDTAYVSDDNGTVYAISPVFQSTSSKTPAVLWSVVASTLSGTGKVMTPPVLRFNLKECIRCRPQRRIFHSYQSGIGRELYWLNDSALSGIQ